MLDKPKTVIGRAEVLNFPELALTSVPARIDTGAKTSSIWVSAAHIEDGHLHAVFFGDGNPHHHGQPVQFPEFEETMVASSTGQLQRRYKVRLKMQMKGRTIRGWFTLADRSTQVYPVLVGRNILRGKYIVDVKQGVPLLEAERQRAAHLKDMLESADPKEDMS